MKDKKEIIKVPQGVLKFGWLSRPDVKFNKEGVYTADVALDPNQEDVKAFIATLRAMGKPKCKLPLSMEKLKDGTETGMVIVKAKSKFAPKLRDAEDNPLADDAKPGSGSTVVLAVTPNPFGPMKDYPLGGVSLYLIGVQFLEIVEFSGGGLFGPASSPKASTPAEEAAEVVEVVDDTGLPF